MATPHATDEPEYDPSKPVRWELDHAASGDRLRAFFRYGEVIAYEEGDWEVRLNVNAGCSAAGGQEDSQLAAQDRALAVYRALTHPRAAL